MKQINKTYFILLFGVLILNSCSNQSNETDTILLDGYWKFQTFIGDGSNYLDIHPQPGDIILDNSDSFNVEIYGEWDRKGKGIRGSFSWKDNYLIKNFKEQDTSAFVRYHYNSIDSGYYEHFVYYPFAYHTTAQVVVKHAEGTDSLYFLQRTRQSKWLSLGVFRIEDGKDSYTEISAITPGEVAADAIMLRPVSSSALLKAKKEKENLILAGYDDSQWNDLKVPGHWGMINKYSNYNGKGWYRKKVSLPADWKINKSERVRLKFDAVYHVANVYFNGQYIGKHQGGFTPFEFDITDKINYDGDNIIAVEADNNFLVGATWNWGGIIRDVYLVKDNDVRIKYQYIHADPILKTGEANLKIKLRIENNSKQIRSIKIKSNILDGKIIATFDEQIEVQPNTLQEINLETHLTKEFVKLWHFDFPNLYQIQTKIYENGKILDTRKDCFGIRKIEITNSLFLLNGEPVRLAGFNRVSDHRFWGSSEPQELINQDVDLMKNAGANFMRIMHGTQNEKLIERCDEKGILIFEEINVRDLTIPEFSDPEYPLAKQWLTEMIERDVNHPSIVGWSVGNEIRNHYRYVNDMITFVKTKLDPYRLVTCVNNNGYDKGLNASNDPYTFCDIIMQNCYFKTQMQIDTIRKRWPDKLIYFSEFGFKKFPTTSLDGELYNLNERTNYLRHKNRFVAGASLWTFNDYRSGYIETTPEENRTWGAVNIWRQKRRLYKQCQIENSPVKDIQIENFDLNKEKAKVTIPIRGMDDYPSYTMKDYRLVWEFRSIDGEVIQSNKIELPELRPIDKTWNGKITWGKINGEEYVFKIALLTPNGYVRYEKNIALKNPPKPKISGIISGDKSIRVCFEKDFGAEEYYIICTDSSGHIIKSKKTIDYYVELDSLTNNHQYQIELVAYNSVGETFSETEMAIPNGQILPPVIYHAFITDSKLVVGYSGESDDINYTVQYGYDKNNLSNMVLTNTRGMIVIDLEDNPPVFFQIRSKNPRGLSNWSNTIKVDVQQ